MTNFTLLEKLKPFICQRCKLTFTTLDSCKLHLRNHAKRYSPYTRKKLKQCKQARRSVKLTSKKDKPGTTGTRSSVVTIPLKLQKKETRLRHRNGEFGNQSNQPRFKVRNTEKLRPRRTGKVDFNRQCNRTSSSELARMMEMAQQPENTRRLRARVDKVSVQIPNEDNGAEAVQFESLAFPVKKTTAGNNVARQNLKEADTNKILKVMSSSHTNVSKCNRQKTDDSSKENQLKQGKIYKTKLGPKAFTNKDLEFVDVNYNDIHKIGTSTTGFKITGPVSKCNRQKTEDLSKENQLKQGKIYKTQLGPKAFTNKDLEFIDVNYNGIHKINTSTTGFKITGPVKRTPDGRFKCRVCEKSYKTNCGRWHHEKKHDKSACDKKPPRVRCNICLKDFAGDYLTKHMRIHTGLGRYKCEFCDREFNQKIQLTLHTRMHTGDKRYQCEHCDRLFTRKLPLKTHVISVHQVVPYDDNGKRCKVFTCKYCGKMVANLPTLQIHERSHSGEKPHKCETCGKGFNHKSNLKEHSRVHSDERPYPCEYCGWRFRYRANLKSHLQMHLDIRNFECKICGSKFVLKTALELHLRIHEGKQAYHCPYCKIGSRFVQPMKDHIKLHHSKEKVQVTPSKNLECPKCHQQFSIDYALARHINLHTRKFMCKICNVPFSCARMLKMHLSNRPHEEVAKNPNSNKLHRCTECKAIFFEKKSFIEHIRCHPNLSKCYVCDITCSNKDELKCHKSSSAHKQKNEHATSHVEHMCTSCDETFPSLAKLNAHIHTHMENFKCDICNINFLSEGALDEHKEKKKHVRAAKLQPQPDDGI